MPFHIAVRRLAVQVQARGLPVSVPEAGEEDRGRREPRDHPGRLGRRKFAELKRYMDERGLQMPLLGNVYVLNRRAAEKMASGSPPGLLGGAGAGRDRSGRKPTAADGGLARAPRARGQDGGRAQGTRLRRRVHRRHARRPSRSPGSSTAPRSWSRSGRSAAAELQFGDAERLLSGRPRRRPKPHAHVPADRARRRRQDVAGAVGEDAAGHGRLRRSSSGSSPGSTASRRCATLFERFEYLDEAPGLRL